jgi:hypothetical protein
MMKLEVNRRATAAVDVVEPLLEQPTRRLVLSFLRLAVAALLVSGVFVVLVAIARTPLVELVTGRGYLYTALVGHVVFALDIWLLSFSAVLWVIGMGRLGALPTRPVGLGVVVAALGAALLAAVPLAGQGQPIMADYMPVLVHPVFLLGFVVFFVGIALPAVALLAALGWFRRPAPPDLQALGIGAGAYLAALAAVVLAGARWGTVDHATLVWGGGHLLQLVNATALVSLWLRSAPVLGRIAKALVRSSLFVGGVLGIGAVLLVHLSTVRWEEVAIVFWTATGLPVVVTWLVVVAGLLARGRRGSTSRSSGPVLPLSLLLFAAGGLIALPGMGDDTRITAHYHGVVGAVTVIFMGQAYQLLPRLGLPLVWGRIARIQPYLYGGGLLLLVAGLYLAAEYGATRKTFEAISRGELTTASVLFGLGALATVVGGVAFVTSVGLSVLGEPSGTPARRVDTALAARVPLVS